MMFFIRHGERADNCPNERHDVINHYDPHLTVVGRDQAKKTGASLKKLIKSKKLKKIIILSSPFLRCLQTAEQIANELDQTEIHIQMELSECLYSTHFDQDPLPTIRQNFTSKDKVLLFPESKTPTYPETPENVTERIVAFLQQLVSLADPNTAYIVVTHQRPVKVVLETLHKESEVNYCAVAAFDKNQQCFMEGTTLY